MRELKFRAWHKNFQIMLEVNNINFDHSEIVGTQEDGTRIICYDNSFELMQFTGLIDKNGKEIYEGDIVKDRKQILIVTDIFECGYRHGEYSEYNEDCEVIGNIHENGDLLCNQDK